MNTVACCYCIVNICLTFIDKLTTHILLYVLAITIGVPHMARSSLLMKGDRPVSLDPLNLDQINALYEALATAGFTIEDLSQFWLDDYLLKDVLEIVRGLSSAESRWYTLQDGLNKQEITRIGDTICFRGTRYDSSTSGYTYSFGEIVMQFVSMIIPGADDYLLDRPLVDSLEKKDLLMGAKLAYLLKENPILVPKTWEGLIILKNDSIRLNDPVLLFNCKNKTISSEGSLIEHGVNLSHFGKLGIAKICVS